MILPGPVVTMSSREIAELTGKQHRNVMRDIRAMLAELDDEGGRLSFEQSYTNDQGKKQPCFNLPKRETLILVSGYNVQMRARIIDRWQELEAQAAAPALPNFSDPVAAARAWADAHEGRKIEEQKRQALEDLPRQGHARPPDDVSYMRIRNITWHHLASGHAWKTIGADRQHRQWLRMSATL